MAYPSWRAQFRANSERESNGRAESVLRNTLTSDPIPPRQDGQVAKTGCWILRTDSYTIGMSDQENGHAGSKESEPGFDARLHRLEEIVSILERGDLELEQSIQKYKEGVSLLKDCRDRIGGYAKQVEELSRDASASLQPYAGDPDATGPNAPEA
ncbi:MAG: exodeoxyribonuclease VII small subunit [Planctomycetota bacterium]